jgi:hypothetical protein
MTFQKIKWSPVEIDFLKKNKNLSINQLTVALAKSKNAINQKLKELDGVAPPKSVKKSGNYSKMGRRPDCNNLYLRSKWEANCYRYFMQTKEIIKIEYEPVDFTFWQFGIKKGTISYTPDFKLYLSNDKYIWVEVKGGWLKQQDKTKIKRFQKYYPDEFKLLQAIVPSPSSKTTKFFIDLNIPIFYFYNELNKEYKNVIEKWE